MFKLECLANLFLDSAGFVQDVFNTIHSRSYIPGARPAPKHTPESFTGAPTKPSLPNYDDSHMFTAPTGPQNGSRKRTFNDRGDGDAQDRGQPGFGNGMNGRAFKQPRRGGQLGRGGRNEYGNGAGRGQGSAMNMPPHTFPSMPQLPCPPPGMPAFDPSNPMAFMQTMQAMGFPVPSIPNPSQGAPRGGFPGSQRGQSSGRGRCRDYETKGYCSRGNTCRFEHGPESVYVASKIEEYDPTNVLMSGIETAASPAGFQQNQNGFNSPRGSDRGRGRGQRGDRGGAPRGRGGRAEFSSDRPNHDRSKTTIVVENIPEEKFNEEEIRTFFSEFGQVMEVDMRPYKRLAIIKFDTWDASNAAYRSPKVIFDNRFVKVFWYTGDDCLPKQTQKPTGMNGKQHGGDAQSESAEPQIDIEEFTRKQEEVQRAYEQKMKKKQEMETQQEELQKRQEELLKSQAEEKRKLMERLAAKTGKSTALSSDTKSESGAPTSQTEALKAQLAALEAEAKSLGIDPNAEDPAHLFPYRGRGRGRGAPFRGRAGFVPRGRGADRGGSRGRGAWAGVKKSIDNRPRKIAIGGHDFTNPDKDESLRSFLLGVGEPIAIEAAAGRTTLEFKERWEAEKFFYGLPGGELPGVGKIEMSWVQQPLPPVDLSKFQVNQGVEGSGQGDDGDVDMGGGGGGEGDVGEQMGGGNGGGQMMAQDELDYDNGEVRDW